MATRDEAQNLAGNASAERALQDLPAEPAPPRDRDLTAAAFFDVDNTLVQGSSLVHFGRGLAARKYFQYSEVWKFLYAQAKFQLTGKENSDDVAAGRRKALAFIEGRTTEEFTALGEEIYDEIIADKIWPGTRALAQAHLDAGQQVWLVTATPYELAEIIAKRLGRKMIGFGKPKTLLNLHETLTWLGALMVLVHAGVHSYTILPWLALAAMLVNVVSGMTGKFLLDRSRRFLSEKREAYAAQGISGEEIEKRLFWDATAFDLMKQWRTVHLPITLAFGVLVIAHVFSILLFWQWK